jgi:hypothetical protein
MALLVTAGAFAVAASGPTRDPGSPFTQLWLLPSPDEGVAQVGIENHESRVVSYRLVVSESDGLEVYEWPSIHLDPGASWKGVVTLPPYADGARLDAALYVADSPQVVYRHVMARLGTLPEVQ